MMNTTRREFLRTGAAAAGWTLLPSGLAMASVDLGGGATLITLSDGTITQPASAAFEGNDPAEVASVLTGIGADPNVSVRALNVTLLRTGERTVIFDTGSGPNFIPGTGLLGASLDAAGVSVEEVTDVIYTHAHPDHLWGMQDDFDELLFPNADYYIGQKEFEYWTDPATAAAIGPALEAFAVGAARRLEFISDRVNLFDGGASLPGGVTAVEAFGHTPGHMAFRIDSDGTMIIADCVVNSTVALARPDWPAGMDTDKDQGIATRMGVLQAAATDKFRVVGYHLSDGGIGYIERAGDSFHFTPET